MRALLILAACAALGSCATLPTHPIAFAAPVLNADFPDPTVIRDRDGSYYGYATQSERGGRMVNIQVARSSDLVHWQYIGDALPAKPGWASSTQDFWAPHVSRDGAHYLMYYSAKPDNADAKHGLCLGIATATSPVGPFVDMGHPLQCGEGFINIDPMAFDDPVSGKRLLYWGSGFAPIKVQELGSDRMSFAAGTRPTDVVWPAAGKDKFPVLVEGAWVIRRQGYYYIFYSGDNCCGAKANYAVMVARSRSAFGPFQTLEQARGTSHSIILGKSGYWTAPGHNSIVTNSAGEDFIVYHAVDVRRPREKASDDVNTRRVMLIDRIRWRHGWPAVDTPRQTGPAPATM